MDLLPLVVDTTFGGWTPSGFRVLKDFAHRRAERTGKDPGEAIPHFLQALSLQLQRGNAELLSSGCLPTT